MKNDYYDKVKQKIIKDLEKLDLIIKKVENYSKIPEIKKIQNDISENKKKLEIILEIFKDYSNSNPKLLQDFKIEMNIESKKSMNFIKFDINDDGEEIGINLFEYVDDINNLEEECEEICKIYEKNENIEDSREIIESINTALKKILDDKILVLEMLPILQGIIKEKQSAIIVGKNGVGKSKFLQDMKEIKLENCVVIPANKNLFVDDKLMESYTDNKEIKQKLKEQKLKEEKSKYEFNNNSKKLNRDNNLISYLVSFYVTENNISKEDKGELTSKLDEVKKIWKEIFPEIEIFTHSGNRTLEFSKNKGENKYSFNQLSDGERSALYYILLICLFSKRSLIVVDEPETHLNIALCNKLWDVLLKYKKESKFIFISHNKDFISSRVESDIFWCKNYDLNNHENNEFIKIENDDVLPKELIISLLGSKEEKILFCEGKIDSYDYRIFNLLYGDEYHVIPVEGHLQVINYTKAYDKYSKSKNSIKKIYGIIDRDYMDEEDINNFQKSKNNKKIIILPVNEIEMFFLNEILLEAVLNKSSEGKKKQVESKIKEFKNKLKKELNDNKTKYALEYCKSKFNKILSYSNVKYNDNDEEKLKSSLKEIQRKLCVKEMKKKLRQRKKTIKEFIKNDDYEGFLKVFSLKRKNLMGIDSIVKEMNSNYIENCFIAMEDEEIKEKLKNYIGLNE